MTKKQTQELKKMLTTRNLRKEAFILALAEYLAGQMGMKSIELEMGKPHAAEWARLRDAANLLGWLSVAETEKHLKELLK